MRKRPSPKRRRPAPETALKALTAAGAIAAGTQAYAAPVRFDNVNPTWNWQLGPRYSVIPEQFLDLTLDSSHQGDTYMGYTNLKQMVYYGTVQMPTATALYGYGGIMSIDGAAGTFAFAVDPGTPIGDPGQAFSILAGIKVDYYGSQYSYIPEGVQTYIGARVKIDYQQHYAWIGVVRNGFSLETFAWGYESEAGVPVPAGAPEPSTLALLALGFCAASRRR